MTSSEPARSRRSFATPRVLVVDDDRSMCELVAAALHADGYLVIQAGSGDEAAQQIEMHALASLGQPPFDMLVSDLHMAHGDGMSLARRLRQSGHDIPIVFVTAFPAADVIEQAKLLDAMVLAKPFSLSALRRMVLTTIAAARAVGE